MRYLTQSEADAIKNLLLTGTLSRPIRLNFPDMGIKLSGDSLTSAKPSVHFQDRRMMERQIVPPDGEKALSTNGSNSDIYINLGEWGYKTRLKDTHICFGTRTFGMYFCQFELSTCLTDGDNVLLTKNISSLAGEGAISRLNKNAASRVEKCARRERLVKLLDTTTEDHEGVQHLVVATIRLSELKNNADSNHIFTGLLEDLLKYSLLVESLITSKETLHVQNSFRSKKGFRSQMSAADKKRIEKAAEDFAIQQYTRLGFEVERVSGIRGLGYDLVARRKKENLYIEVKGTTTGVDWSITITRNEFNAAKDKGVEFVLFVVTLDNIDDLNVVSHENFADPTNAKLTIRAESYSVCKQAPQP